MGCIDNEQIKVCHPSNGSIDTPTNNGDVSILGASIPGTGFLGWLTSFGSNLLSNFSCFITYAWWLMAVVYIPLFVIWIYGLVGILGGG